MVSSSDDPSASESGTKDNCQIMSEASENPADTSASKAEASTDDIASAMPSSEEAADAKPEENGTEAKKDASGRPIPEQWKKRCR